ncbi:hypothetical protein LINPERHAP1_LOCUS4726 [Linum perenne]
MAFRSKSSFTSSSLRAPSSVCITVFFNTPATLEKVKQLISVAAPNQSRDSSGEEARINDDDLKRYDSAIDLPGEELHLSFSCAAFVLD